jgi:hypothetical protein
LYAVERDGLPAREEAAGAQRIVGATEARWLREAANEFAETTVDEGYAIDHARVGSTIHARSRL